MPGARVERYDTRPTEPRPAPPEVERAIAEARTALGMTLHPDARLAKLARMASAQMSDAEDTPAREIVDFLARHLGLVEAWPRVHPFVVDTDAQMRTLAGRVGELLVEYPFTHYGATVEVVAGHRVAVLALSTRHIELSPVSVEGTLGEPIRIRGRLLPGYANPRVEVEAPHGDRLRFPAGSGPLFDVRVPTRAPGIYRIELVAQGGSGVLSLARFPVYIEVDVPRHLNLSERSVGADFSVARANLFERINEARTDAGLAPLEAHALAEAVASRQAAAVRDRRATGRGSGAGASADERAQRAGLGQGLVLENVGTGLDAVALHRRFMQSAGQRANILNPDVTHLGIGIVAADRHRGGGLLATLLLLSLAPSVDIESAPADVLAMLNRNRRARGVPELQTDHHLQQAATQKAEAFFGPGRPSERATVDAASAAVERFSIAFSRVSAVMAVVRELGEAAALEPALDSEARHVGIGVAQGDRMDTGPRATAVVIVLGWPR